MSDWRGRRGRLRRCSEWRALAGGSGGIALAGVAGCGIAADGGVDGAGCGIAADGGAGRPGCGVAATGGAGGGGGGGLGRRSGRGGGGGAPALPYWAGDASVVGFR